MNARSNNSRVANINTTTTAAKEPAKPETTEVAGKVDHNKLQRNITYADLSSVLCSILAPVVSAIDIRPGTDTDNGHQLASQQDSGLRVTLGYICSFLHRQLHGEIDGRNGGKIPNAAERVKDSIAQMDAIQQRYAEKPEDMQVDDNYFVISYWLNVNNSRYDALEEMLNGFKDAYKEIVGVEWTPTTNQRRTTNIPINTAMRDKLTQALKVTGTDG